MNEICLYQVVRLGPMAQSPVSVTLVVPPLCTFRDYCVSGAPGCLAFDLESMTSVIFGYNPLSSPKTKSFTIVLDACESI